MYDLVSETPSHVPCTALTASSVIFQPSHVSAGHSVSDLAHFLASHVLSYDALIIFCFVLVSVALPSNFCADLCHYLVF